MLFQIAFLLGVILQAGFAGISARCLEFVAAGLLHVVLDVALCAHLTILLRLNFRVLHTEKGGGKNYRFRLRTHLNAKRTWFPESGATPLDESYVLTHTHTQYSGSNIPSFGFHSRHSH